MKLKNTICQQIIYTERYILHNIFLWEFQNSEGKISGIFSWIICHLYFFFLVCFEFLKLGKIITAKVILTFSVIKCKGKENSLLSENIIIWFRLEKWKELVGKYLRTQLAKHLFFSPNSKFLCILNKWHNLTAILIYAIWSSDSSLLYQEVEYNLFK